MRRTKILSMFFIIIGVLFLNTLCVNAATLVKEGNEYVFSWKDLKFEGNNDYKVSCSNSNINGKYVRRVESGNVIIEQKEGKIKFKPTIENGQIECKIFKDDAGNPVIDSATIMVGTTTTTTTTTKPPATTTTKQDSKSNDASLKMLTVKDNEGTTVVLTPEFSSTVYEYDGMVSGTVKTVNIEPVANHDKANIVISSNASQELKDGENNKITITVTAEDGETKKTYTLNIKKDALTSDATLSALEIEELPDFEFDASIFKYDVKIKEEITKLTLKYTASDEKSIVTVSGNEDLANGSKIKILVTAEDGTKKEYVITISKNVTTTKKNTQVKKSTSEKNPFIIMALSMTAFGLIGAIVYVSKK